MMDNDEFEMRNEVVDSIMHFNLWKHWNKHVNVLTICIYIYTLI